MSKEILLNPDMLYNWDFKVDARGYRLQEVDKFLDMVIRDYTEFLRTIKKLEQDNINLIEDNRKLQNEYRKLQQMIDATSKDASALNKAFEKFIKLLVILACLLLLPTLINFIGGLAGFDLSCL